jgi:hypothetical protein
MSISLLRRLLMKEAVKDTAGSSGIMSINKNIAAKVEQQLQRYVNDAMRQGVDLDTLSPEQLKMIVQMNKPKPPRVIAADSPEGRGITEALLGKRGEVVDFPQKRSFKQEVDDMIKDGTITKGARGMKKSKKVQDREMFQDANKRLKTDVNKIIADIKAMDPMDSMKEANSVIGRKGVYKNLTPEESKKILKDTEDHIFERDIPIDPEDMATGGRAGFKGGGLTESDYLKVKDMLNHYFDYRKSGGTLSKTKFANAFFRENNADGGVAGLLGERTGFQGGGASYKSSSKSSKSKSKSSTSKGPAGGASAGGNYGGNVNPNQTYAGRTLSQRPSNYGGTGPSTTSGGGGGPPGTNNPPPIQTNNSPETITFDDYTGKKMNFLNRINRNKFLDYVKNQGSYEMGEDEEADALYDAYRLATGRDKFMQDVTVDSVSNMRTTDIDGNTKSFFDRNATITDNPTGDMYKSLMVQTPTSFTQRFMTPSGIMENDIAQSFGAPQSLSVQPYADGGPARQNFKMGKRAFLKAMLGTGAGIAGLKSGLFGIGGKEATKKAVTETVKSAGSGTPPPYFFKLVDKIKTMGDDTLATTDKAIAKKYKDYTMEEDFAGNIEIIKKGDNVAEDVYMSYKVDDVPLRGKKGSKKVEEYEEYTARPDAEGKMKDIEQGVPDEVVNEGSVFEDNLTEFGMTKKASGGIARMLGE